MSPPIPDADAPVGGAQIAVVDGPAPIDADARMSESASASLSWPELVVVGAAVLLATTGTFGLLLAVLDRYRMPLTLAVSVPVTLVAVVLLRRGTELTPLDRIAATGWIVAAVISVGFVLFVATAPSQHLLIDRDPGSYVSTARWLADHPGLTVDARTGGFEDAPAGDLVFGGAAVYRQRNGELQFQFNHMAPVLMAVAFGLAGTAAMLLLPSIATALGLLAVYAVTVRVTSRPLLALLAPAALAVSMPMLFVARDAFSEPFVFALLWSAVIVGVWNFRAPSLTAGAVGGLLLGSLVAIRVDALLLVGLAVPLMVVSLMASAAVRRSALVRSYCVMTATLGLVMTVGFIDLRQRTGRYERDLGFQLDVLRLLTIAAFAASAVLLVVWFTLPRLRAVVRPWRSRPALICALVLVALVLSAWLIRPLVLVDTAPLENSTVESIQQRDGLGLQPDRSYAEYSLWWMSWYLGPATVAAAIAGIGICCYGVLRGRARPAGALVLFLVLGTGTMYWWRPSNTPDQVWVMRRFVPSVLPCLAVLAVVTVAELVRRWGGSGVRRVALVSAATVLMVVPPSVTTWPVRQMSFQTGYIDVMEQLCAVLGEDASVLLPKSYEQLVLAQPIRSWCGVPVAIQGRPFSSEDFAAVGDLVAARGRRLWVVALDGEALAALDMDAGAVVSTGSATVEHMPEPRLDGPPTRFIDPDDTLPWFVPSPFALHARPIETR